MGSSESRDGRLGWEPGGLLGWFVLDCRKERRSLTVQLSAAAASSLVHGACAGEEVVDSNKETSGWRRDTEPAAKESNRQFSRSIRALQEYESMRAWWWWWW